MPVCSEPSDMCRETPISQLQEIDMNHGSRVAVRNRQAGGHQGLWIKIETQGWKTVCYNSYSKINSWQA